MVSDYIRGGIIVVSSKNELIIKDIKKGINSGKYLPGQKIPSENELAEKFNIMSIPCLVVFENGKEVKRSVGFIPKEEIKKLI